ncbi:unconventional myosin-XV-like [Triplophysa rosa]|uniref:unconventional myosin-XV-like n=1 Tax=Triplophysa rosa TaxID=992332 RepID=UPI002545BF3A|nr:unconventional myosin-XV-like [Triplophysa rosa]
MPAKKGDSKSAAKKGGKPEPEKNKPKEEENKGKDDKKGGKDDKKADKKGGKDDKKKGKEEPPKGKGKDDKKGKDKGKGKKEVIESEEGSDAELLEEDLSEEEDEESDGGKRKRGGGKDPKGKAAKGKSKSRQAYSDEDEDSEKEDEDEEDEDEDSEEEDRKAKKKSKDKSKSNTEDDPKKKKARKKEEPPPEPPPEEKKKRGLKNTSKLFMRFSGFKRKKNSKKRLKNTSRLFLGLGKRKSRLVRKKRRKSLLRNAPRFMMRFKNSKKKKKEKEKKNADKAGPKPTYMLLKLGGNSKPAEKKTGFFKGLFGKKNAEESGFKTRGQMLGKIAGATNWLTKRFLSLKGRQSAHRRDNGWGRSNNKKYAGSRQASIRAGYQGYHNHGYEHDTGGYDYDNQSRGGAFHRQPSQRPSNRYGEQYASMHGQSSFPQQYTQYEEPNNYYDIASHDQGYYDMEDGYYDPHMIMQDGGEYYDDGMDYSDPYAAQEQMGSYPEDMGYYSQQHPFDSYFDDGMEYYDDSQYPMGNSYDLYGNEMDMYSQAQFGYYEDLQGVYVDPYGRQEMEITGDQYVDLYGDYEDPYFQDYQVNYSETDVDPYLQSSYNIYQPYGYPMQDIMEGEEGMYGDKYADFSVENMPFHGEMEFRVPRPQVKLFGKERIDVELPPLPPQYDFDEMSDIQYENHPYLPGTYMDDAFAQAVPPQEMFHPTMPQVPTPTAMLIKQANNPQGFVGQNMAHMAQPGGFPPSPTPSRRSVAGMASPLHRPMAPMLPMAPMSPMAYNTPMANFGEPVMEVRRSPVPVRRPSPHSSPQLSMRPAGALPLRRTPSPQPSTFSATGVIQRASACFSNSPQTVSTSSVL